MSAEYRSGVVQQALTDNQKAELGGQGAFLRTCWLSSAEDREVSLWLGNRDGTWDRVELDVITEVFPGEGELRQFPARLPHAPCSVVHFA